MLLAVDVGNTQTVLGLYEGELLTDHWRLATDRTRTGDELTVLLGGLLDPDAVDAICLSTTVPMRSPTFGTALPKGKTWMRVDLDLAAAKLGLDVSELLQTSRTLGPLEHGIVSTTRVGTAAVAGKATTRYKVVIDTKRAAKAVPAFAKQLRTIERAGVRLPRLTENVWIGADGRITRVGLSFPLVQQGVPVRSSMTMTFRAYDVPVSVSAPPRAQVFDFS